MTARPVDRIRIVDGFVPMPTCGMILHTLRTATATPLALLSVGSADTMTAMESHHDDGVRRTDLIDATAVEGTLNAELQRLADEVIVPAYGPVAYWEAPQVMRYPPGGHYAPHVDGEYEYPDGWRRISDRDVSVVWFLNRGFDGGDLVFPAYRLRVAPAPGTVVVFPSTRDYEHGVEPVVAGERWAVVTWMVLERDGYLSPDRPAHVNART